MMINRVASGDTAGGAVKALRTPVDSFIVKPVTVFANPFDAYRNFPEGQWLKTACLR